jgi:hypothetical protein
LWRDQVRLGVGPDRLVLAAYRRGVHPRLVRKDILRVEPGDAAEGWRPALDAIPSTLAASPTQRPDVSVVLSNMFVRYALLPWNPALRTEAEWMALARHRLESVHAQAPGDWELRVTETMRGGPLVACAVERALLDALEERIAEGRGRLLSVQPYLMAAFNRLRHKISNQTCWLVIEEPGCLLLVLIQRGSWMSIRNRRVDERWREEFSEILERESALLALDEPCNEVVVYTPSAFETDSLNGYHLRDLTLARGTARDDQPFAMALA